MYLTGFADEAAPDIDNQIRITKSLGWKNIESRNIDGTNLHELSEEDFDQVAGKLEEAGVRVNCFGSTIANWAKDVNDDFDITLGEVGRAIPRMQRLGSKLVRIMSYKVVPGEDLKKEERFRRLREVQKRFSDAGRTVVHENCMNYGGMSVQHTLELVENVPGLKLVFDTGNCAFNKDQSKPEPRPYQNSWEFYQTVKEHVEYIHIKDAKKTEGPKEEYTFPGEGDGDVDQILEDLVKTGYEGGISIEPHLAAVFHNPDAVGTDSDKSEELYVEYGQRLMKKLDALGAQYD